MHRLVTLLSAIAALATLAGCSSGGADNGRVRDTLMVSDSAAAFADSASLVPAQTPFSDSGLADGTVLQDTAFLPPSKTVDTKGVAPSDVVAFAKTLLGTPYVYGSTDPKVGFDCSGFITYV